MMKIDTDRLGILLDRAADIATAAQRAQGDLAEAEQALAEHRGDAAARAMLVSRVERRREAYALLRKRAALWSPYADKLRSTAAAGGVRV